MRFVDIIWSNVKVTMPLEDVRSQSVTAETSLPNNMHTTLGIFSAKDIHFATKYNHAISLHSKSMRKQSKSRIIVKLFV